MAAASRPKVTVKLGYENPPSRPSSRTALSRPPSPLKSQPPPPRPKAKVNRSAVLASGRTTKHTNSSLAVASASTTPRAASPAKQPPRFRNGTLSPTFQPKAEQILKSTLRPLNPPELRHRSLTSASSDTGRPSHDKRSRNGSLSLHHAMSFSSLQGSNSSSVGSYSPPLTPTEPITSSDHERSHSPSLRIKSKVSTMAPTIGHSLSPPSSFPSRPATRLANHRARTPSASSVVSSPPSHPPAFYPITTATPAANPHRFAANRPSPRQPQPFHQPHDDARVDCRRRNGFAKVDPENIPSPPNSPPASTVSFSSHSSVSHNEDSVDNTDQARDVERLRATLDNLMLYTEMGSNEDTTPHPNQEMENQLVSSDRTVEAEAKSIRKIADLEITNRSLLAINASLETAKHRQEKEIRELRRKLRESRLILPPRVYQAVKSSADHDDIIDEDETADDDEEDDEDALNDGDQIYKRIKLILEGLLESGRRALETTTADFSTGAKGVAKVLNAEEVRTWRDSSGSTPDYETQIEQRDTDTVHQLLVIPDNGSFDSEEEVEAMMRPHDFLSQSPITPPILITESH